MARVFLALFLVLFSAGLYAYTVPEEIRKVISEVEAKGYRIIFNYDSHPGVPTMSFYFYAKDNGILRKVDVTSGYFSGNKAGETFAFYVKPSRRDPKVTNGKILHGFSVSFDDKKPIAVVGGIELTHLDGNPVWMIAFDTLKAPLPHNVKNVTMQFLAVDGSTIKYSLDISDELNQLRECSRKISEGKKKEIDSRNAEVYVD